MASRPTRWHNAFRDETKKPRRVCRLLQFRFPLLRRPLNVPANDGSPFCWEAYTVTAARSADVAGRRYGAKSGGFGNFRSRHRRKRYFCFLRVIHFRDASPQLSSVFLRSKRRIDDRGLKLLILLLRTMLQRAVPLYYITAVLNARGALPTSSGKHYLAFF